VRRLPSALLVAAIVALIVNVALLVPWLTDKSTDLHTGRGSIQHARASQ
jgi:hypothetical protein